jgi:hypothetical protein
MEVISKFIINFLIKDVFIKNKQMQTKNDGLFSLLC